MTRREVQELERIQALLADRATEGLDATQAAELSELAALHPEVDPDGFDRTAAMIDVALAGAPGHPLPRPFTARILAGADRFFAAGGNETR